MSENPRYVLAEIVRCPRDDVAGKAMPCALHQRTGAGCIGCRGDGTRAVLTDTVVQACVPLMDGECGDPADYPDASTDHYREVP